MSLVLVTTFRDQGLCWASEMDLLNICFPVHFEKNKNMGKLAEDTTVGRLLADAHWARHQSRALSCRGWVCGDQSALGRRLSREEPGEAGQARCAPARPAASCESSVGGAPCGGQAVGGRGGGSGGWPLGCAMLAVGRRAQGPAPGPSTPGDGSGSSTSGA